MQALKSHEAGRAGVAAGPVRVTLRLEGLAALAVAAILYRATGASWREFALLFLAPDLSILGYLAGPRIGAAAYNVGHTYVSPAILAVIGVVVGAPMIQGLALIWVAHIGVDRMLGYGLKYSTGFGVTHLGLMGKWT